MVKSIKGKAALEKWEPGMLALGNGYAVLLKNKKQFKEKPGWECEYLGYPEGTLYRCFTTNLMSLHENDEVADIPKEEPNHRNGIKKAKEMIKERKMGPWSCVPGRNPTPTLLKKSGVRRQAGVNGDGRVPDSDNDDEDEEEEEDIVGSNSLAKKANDDAQRSPVAVKIGNGASKTAKKDVQDREIDDGIGGSNDGGQGKKTEEFDEACRDIADYVGAPTVAGDDPIRKEEKTQEENGDGDCHAVGHVGVGPSAPSFLIQSERQRNGSGGIPEFEGRTNRRRLFNEVADFEDPQPPPKMARQEERAEGWVAWGMRKVAGFFS